MIQASNSLWSAPPIGLTLSHTAVHIWLAALDQPLAQNAQWAEMLTADERTRAERFYVERDRMHFVAARGLLRMILGRYLEIEPRQVSFVYGPRGKPALDASQHSPGLRFNMSHSGGLALYAFALEREVGVDLEYERPLVDADKIAERFFSAYERTTLRDLPSPARQHAFFECWTRKEAYIKATGDGLSLPLDQFDVSLTPGEPARLLNVASDPREAVRWSLRDLVTVPGYAAALAVEGEIWTLSCWQWMAEDTAD